jgi:Ca2+-binding EF-hand superfamily protein
MDGASQTKSRRLRNYALAGTAAILLAGTAGGIAYADRGHHRGGMMMNLAERYDGNNDGKVTQEEIDSNRAQWLAEFDADKSGDLSIAEFEKLWLKARREQMVREYQEFDRDGDGKMTLDEYRRPMANTVANMDRNGDGALSRDDRRRMRSNQQENSNQ